MLPETSSTLTTGWVPQAAPSTPPPGCGREDELRGRTEGDGEGVAGGRAQSGRAGGQRIGAGRPGDLAAGEGRDARGGGHGGVGAAECATRVLADGEGDAGGAGGHLVPAGVLDRHHRLGRPGRRVGAAAWLGREGELRRGPDGDGERGARGRDQAGGAGRQRVAAGVADDLAPGEGRDTPGGRHRVWSVQVRAAPVPGWEAMVSDTAFVAVVIGFPPASSTVATGWLVQVAPLAPPPGWAGEGQHGGRTDADGDRRIAGGGGQRPVGGVQRVARTGQVDGASAEGGDTGRRVERVGGAGRARHPRSRCHR